MVSCRLLMTSFVVRIHCLYRVGERNHGTVEVRFPALSASVLLFGCDDSIQPVKIRAVKLTHSLTNVLVR